MTGIDSGDTAFILVSTFLVFIMTLGIAFFYGGMVRRRNVVNTMMMSVAVAGLISVVWVVAGYSLAFGDGKGTFVGAVDKLFLNGVTPDSAHGTLPELVFAAYQGMFALITVAIISGAIAERMRFSRFLVFIAAWVLVVYAPLAHMVWGGGFISTAIGSLDFAGGDVVHISSGVSGLVLALIVGGRTGYGKLSYHPHNIPFVLLGTLFLWLGWFGFNAGSALAANGIAGLAAMTTNTSACTGLLTWMLLERLTTGKCTLLGACSGAVAGLVAITPGAGYVEVPSSIAIGAIVTVACFFACSKLKPRLGYDDALDAFGVHGLGGMVGTLLTGVFCTLAANPDGAAGLIAGDPTQLGRQALSVVLVAVYAGVATFAIAKVIELVGGPLRVSAKDEARGLDQTLHGETAYPAFTGMDLN
jgi:Amt family ammonium transporter